ncbi:LLM class flavin-dependent oxidoreductase [Nonomuraea sp. NPDC005650]|uniref:LLM class flavin-dependent oxidoreductase n=1 Tax=Nonomuraea sp. NPDC005650 TaxID=3157045 RepID=UPI0033B20AB7
MTGTAARTHPVIALRYDLRAPDFGPSHAELFAAMLDQVVYADQNGLERVHVSEHHHTTDGYLPSVFPALAAIAARTSRVRIRPSALILPLHDPVRIAEDAAVVDNISGGRLDVTVGAGYREVEFRMLARGFADRGTRLRHAVQVLRRAWSGEQFTWDDRPVLVRPLPVQRDGPPIIMGGSTPRTARRAAEIADGYDPASPSLIEDYLMACAELGKQPGEHLTRVGPFFLHLADDPERTRHLLARHVQHEMQQYASWNADSAHFGAAPDIPLESVWQVGSHRVLTPDEAIELVRGFPPNSLLTLNPLSGGTPPALAHESLRLFVEKVLPAVRTELDATAGRQA